MNSVHASEVSEGYRPPKKVADEIVQAALSKIPGAQTQNDGCPEWTNSTPIPQ